jgi:hypothetical protein
MNSDFRLAFRGLSQALDLQQFRLRYGLVI